MGEPLVRAQGLFKFHGQGGDPNAILRDVSFQVDAGEFVCIMGPSGSGKTTLLHLLSGLDEPSAGTVELGGVSLAGLNTRKRTLRRRDQVGYVFQFFNLMPNLSVLPNCSVAKFILSIRFPVSIHSIPWCQPSTDGGLVKCWPMKIIWLPRSTIA